MRVFVGDDWAKDHHDLYVMDQHGNKLAGKQVPEGPAGMTEVHTVLAQFVDEPGEVTIGIETERGMWVQALLAAGYGVYALNPLAAARYRDRHSVGGAKSDTGDAKVLADAMRTDAHNHRPVAADSAAVDALKVVARAHQSLIWERTRHSNRLGHSLSEYFPAAIQAFPNLGHSDALSVLTKTPVPADAARLSISQIRAVLRRGGRRRYLDTRAKDIQKALRSPQLVAQPAVNAAFAATAASTVAILIELNRQIGSLEVELAIHYCEHPDAAIYRSMPGLGVVLGARVLAEFGDDPDAYKSAKARRNYAGTSPLTRQSGRRRLVVARYVRNRRLADAIDQWAFCSIRTSPGCRRFYDEHRAAGDLHHQALRALGNRLVGYLHGCLRTGLDYDEHQAWAHRWPQEIKIAA